MVANSSAGWNRVINRCRCGLVRFAMHITALGTGAGNYTSVTIRPVIATVIAVVVARGADSPLWAATKLANRDHQRLVQHAPLVKVFDQATQTAIKHGCGLVLHPFTQVLVLVPAVVVRVGNPWAKQLQPPAYRLLPGDGPTGSCHQRLFARIFPRMASGSAPRLNASRARPETTRSSACW